MLVKRISCAMQDLDHMISSDMGLCGVVIAAELTLPTQQMSSQIDHTRARADGTAWCVLFPSKLY